MYIAVYIVNIEKEASFYGFITVELQNLNGSPDLSHPMEQNVPPYGTNIPPYGTNKCHTPSWEVVSVVVYTLCVYVHYLHRYIHR